ncbi:MAG: CPBP family intramembrane metalloprotease [Spirochaetaceae bacterium]|nr:CPBP family intramembrane metalloprotease [Spirochaetaceae bacterium]
MGILLEPLILFCVLFLPGIGFVSPGTLVFSVNRELSRIMVYNIPSFALMWYVLGLTRGTRLPKPGIQDLKTALITFPGLLIIGLCGSLGSLFFRDLFLPLSIEPPGNFFQWVVMAFSVLTTGYVEESYFRLYLLTRLGKTEPGKGVCFSVLLFSLCHVYEGIPGVLNAALAGTFLSFIFLKFRSIHGLAWAHGAYNAAVYGILRILPPG